MIAALIVRTLKYNFAELAFIIAFIASPYIIGEIWPPALWVGFVLGAFWVIATSFKEAEEVLFSGLKKGTLFITDFFLGALLFLVLAYLVRHEGTKFWVMYLVASAQQMRYTGLSWQRLRNLRMFNEDNKETNEDSEQGS